MRLKFLHLHLHGLIRSKNLELGRDADTGGQTQYVFELIKSLANTAEVDQVDLVTRLIKDSKVEDGYSQEEEFVEPGVRILRFKFGPNKYLRKELLWPYLDYLTEGTKAFFNTDPTEVELKEGNFIANEVIRQWKSGEFTTLPRYGYTTRYDKETDTFAIIDRNGKEKTVKFGKTTEGLKALLRQLMVPESIVTNIDYEAIEFGMDKKKSKNKKDYEFDTSIYNKGSKNESFRFYDPTTFNN